MLGKLVISWPPDTNGCLWFWIIVLALGHLAVANIFQFIASRDKVDIERYLVARVFEAVLFSNSIMLFLGIIDKDVMKLISDIQGYLLIAALLGFGYSIYALRPR